MSRIIIHKKVLLFLSALFFLWTNSAFSQSTETVSQGSVRSFTVNGSPDWVYQWALTSPDNNSEILTSASIQSDEITFSQLGTYTLRVQATDNKGCLSDWLSKTIVVQEVSETNPNSPSAIADEYSTMQGISVSGNLLVNDTDLDGDDLTATANNLSSENGSLVIQGDGSFTYTPSEGFIGIDEFTYEVCDNGNPIRCSQGIVTLHVEPSVEELRAVNDDVATNQGEQVRIDVLTNDIGLTEQTVFEVPAQSDQGGTIVKNEDGTLTYIPAEGFSGEDTFTYQLCRDETKTTCSEAIVWVSVLKPAGTNAKPLPVKDINLTWMNSEISGNLLTNDLFYESDKYQLKVITIPLEGAGKLTSFNKKTGEYTFVPAEGYTGEAIFEYQICETNENGFILCGDTSIVTIQVLDALASNQALVANDDAMVIPANTTIHGNFLQNDFDLEANAFSISKVVTTNLPGTLISNVDGSYTYTPEADFTGNVHFNYQICNEEGNCQWSTVSINVLPTEVYDHQTFAADDVFYSMSSGKITGDLSENNHSTEGSQYSYSLVSGIGPVNGNVTLTSDGRFEYIPTNDIDGPFSDQFIYEMCDVNDPTKCSRATAYLMDNPIAPLAVIEADTLSTGACAAIQLDAGNSEGRGDLSYSWTPSTFLDNPGIPNPTFTPGTSTKYIVTVTDEFGRSSIDSVFVTVEPVEVVVDNHVFVTNAPDMIMLDASESIGRNLSFNWWSAGDELIVSGAQTATPEVSGLGKYYLQITDQYGCSAMDSVTVGLLVQVTAMNDTVGMLINTFADINVLENDVPSGELNPQSIAIVSPPGHGFATITSDSLITYTPDQYYVGQDAFIYAVCDYFDRCDEATVLVMISDEALFVPNAFSPNGDGVNDYFEIQGIAKYDQVNFKVFNRWGNLVYQSSNYGEGSNRSGFWDGIANKGIRIGNGEVPTGTYYYILDLGGENQKITGFIYLDR